MRQFFIGLFTVLFLGVLVYSNFMIFYIGDFSPPNLLVLMVTLAIALNLLNKKVE